MAKRDQDVHFLASKEEVERIHEKMDELGIRSMGAYAKTAGGDLDGHERSSCSPVLNPVIRQLVGKSQFRLRLLHKG